MIEELPLIQSQTRHDFKIYSVEDVNETLLDKDIRLRATLQKQRGNFLVLRTRFVTVQGYFETNVSIPNESLIELDCKVVKSEQLVKSTTIQNLELRVNKCYIVSKAHPLPIQVSDCARVTEDDDAMDEEADSANKGDEPVFELPKDAEGNPIDPQTGEKLTPEQVEKRKKNFLKKMEKQKAKKEKKANSAQPKVTQKLRLDNRVLDLRTPANQAIFLIQSKICQFFREFLISKGFQEIHTPKLIATASEGGSNVFKVKYFDQDAYLAQSPQLYKQMAVVSGMSKVFEIGPVFRAEKSFTHRHLTEFTGLDAEMAFEYNYMEALEVWQDLLLSVFTRLQNECQREIDAVASQFGDNVKNLVLKKCIINWKDAMALLKENGIDHPPLDDLDTVTEKTLGRLVKEKYGTDFYILNKFPSAVRPFYTMPDPEDDNYSNSYDMFLRGEEIVSGAQRIHDSNKLLERAAKLNVDLTPVKDYVDCFKYGAPPHAGLGCGLDRITFLFLGLRNVRRGSLFPRDPKRVTP